MELDKLEALWSEIRQSQYLTEKNIQELREVLDSLSSVANATNNNTELFISILKKLDTIQKNIEVSGSEASKEAQKAVSLIQNYIEEFENTIQNLQKSHYQAVEDIEQRQKNLIRKNEERLERSIKTIESSFNESVTKIEKRIKSLIENANETIDDFNATIKNINWTLNVGFLIAGAIAGAIGVYLYLRIHAPVQIVKYDETKELLREHKIYLQKDENGNYVIYTDANHAMNGGCNNDYCYFVVP